MLTRRNRPDRLARPGCQGAAATFGSIAGVGQAVGQSLALAVAAAVSPFPVIGIVLMLTSPRARSNGTAFLLGWLVGCAAVGTAVLVLSTGADASDSSGPATWTGIVRIVLGVLLVFLSRKYWRGRPRGGEEAELPGWMAAIDSFTTRRAAGMGFLLSAANPKNLLLTVGGAVAIAQTGISARDQAIAMAIFVAIASAGVGIPFLLHLALGDRAARTLAQAKTWMAMNNDAIMAILLLVIGAKLIGDGIGAL